MLVALVYSQGSLIHYIIYTVHEPESLMCVCRGFLNLWPTFGNFSGICFCVILEQYCPLAGRTCNRVGDNGVQCQPPENHFYQPHPAQSTFVLRSNVEINVGALQN